MQPSSLPQPPGVSGFAPIFLANLLPLAGVVWLGWDPATLATIYAIELLLSILLASGKALFAARFPPKERDGVVSVSNAQLTNKRGSIELVPWLPPVYLRNIPFAVSVLGGVAWLSIFLGVGLSEVFDLGAVLVRTEVVVSVGALFVGQLVETGRQYIGDSGYEEVSPYSVIETPVRQAFFLTFVLFWTLGVANAVAGTAAVLAVIVLVKLLVEWSAFRAAHAEEPGRFARWLSGPDESDTRHEPVEIPTTEPSARISTDRRAVLLTALLRTLTRTAPAYVPMFTVVWLVGIAVIDPGPTAWIVSGIAIVGLFLAALTIHLAGFALRYGPLEYRRYDEHVIAYDTLLEEAQWSAPIRGLRDASIVQDRFADRVLGTRTIRVTTGWGDDETERYLGPVVDPNALVETFELPIATTDVTPLDRRVATVAATLGGGMVLAAVVLLVGPWAPQSWLYALIGIPMVAFVPWLLWKQAYPDPE